MKRKNYHFTSNKKLREVKSVQRSCVRLKLCFVVDVSPLRDGFVLLNVDIEYQKCARERERLKFPCTNELYANRLSWFHWHWLCFDCSFRTWQVEVISALYQCYLAVLKISSRVKVFTIAFMWTGKWKFEWLAY